VYIRQPAPLGLGHAVLCARPVVGDAPFMVHLADDLIDAKVSCLKQMVDVHATYGGSVLGVQNVPKQDTDNWPISVVGRWKSCGSIAARAVPPTPSASARFDWRNVRTAIRCVHARLPIPTWRR
jgi:UTP--glucose-1-phosphate uridylyltransferase